jgi:hypothetical protein
MGHYRSEMVDIDAEQQEAEDKKAKKLRAIEKRIGEVGIAAVLMEIIEYNSHRIYLPWDWH